MFQFTHPHGVRQEAGLNPNLIYGVSIHAPTRGATNLQISFILFITCFNSRTHTGCDSQLIIVKTDSLCFNSRTHTGCDASKLSFDGGAASVSIHAPTRGATYWVPARGNTASSFNSRTHTGCDILFYKFLILSFKFQFTHPHGVRRGGTRGVFQDGRCFNSRTHTGCDWVSMVADIGLAWFQFTHPHGVRPLFV